MFCDDALNQQSPTFWHQGPVSWKTILPWKGGGMVQAVIQAVMGVMGSGRWSFTCSPTTQRLLCGLVPNRSRITALSRKGNIFYCPLPPNILFWDTHEECFWQVAPRSVPEYTFWGHHSFYRNSYRNSIGMGLQNSHYLLLGPPEGDGPLVVKIREVALMLLGTEWKVICSMENFMFA